MSENMSDGDRQAALASLVPILNTKPKPLFDTKPRLMEPAKYVIAVSSEGITRNQRLMAEGYSEAVHHPLIEVFRLQEKGEMKSAEFVGSYRHIELLGPAWIYHDPEDVLQYNHRRATVLQTESALRVYADTEEQTERVRLGC